MVGYSDEGRQNRIVTHKEVPGTDVQRVRGAEVLWQGEAVDILSGAIPLNFMLPATTNETQRAHLIIRYRIASVAGSGFRLVSVDVWFDIVEELIRDDH